ncbi:MAG: hypothetical protein ACQERU_07525, partial [Bacteroidota bacterium]
DCQFDESEVFTFKENTWLCFVNGVDLYNLNSFALIIFIPEKNKIIIIKNLFLLFIIFRFTLFLQYVFMQQSYVLKNEWFGIQPNI